MGVFSKLKNSLKSSFGGDQLTDSLTKTRKGFVEKVFDVFSGKDIDDDLYEELEEALIQGDVGVNTAMELVEKLRAREKKDKIKYAEDLRTVLVEEIVALMGTESVGLNLMDDELNIILMVGVNGVGKTTSIGKLAHRLKKDGHKVILGAGDTFRAAASEQLKIWGERVGVDVISHQEGADPAAVVFDAIAAAKSRKCDILIVDTAGRLQNKTNLMNELSKMRKVIDREAPGALREVLLVLDATTGQNALSQAKSFGEATGVTGVILTKLDGTAKGGVVIGIKAEYDLPVKLIGVGEQIDQMQIFDPQNFVAALFSGMAEDEDEVAENAVSENEMTEEETEVEEVVLSEAAQIDDALEKEEIKEDILAMEMDLMDDFEPISEAEILAELAEDEVIVEDVIEESIQVEEAPVEEKKEKGGSLWGRLFSRK